MQETDCGMLLDLNNVYVSSFNHGFNADECDIDAIDPTQLPIIIWRATPTKAHTSSTRTTTT